MPQEWWAARVCRFMWPWGWCLLWWLPLGDYCEEEQRKPPRRLYTLGGWLVWSRIVAATTPSVTMRSLIPNFFPLHLLFPALEGQLPIWERTGPGGLFSDLPSPLPDVCDASYIYDQYTHAYIDISDAYMIYTFLLYTYTYI